jgi:dTDP-glucose 4,6-dehydratase
MDLRGQKVLVTGAGGFIGSHLAERLLVSEGCNVKAFVHYNSRGSWGNLEELDPQTISELEVVTGDIRDPFAVADAVSGCSVIFHLCALIAIPYSYQAPQSYTTTNVLGTVNVLQAARKMDVQRIVHTSTSECYGTAAYVPIDEQHSLSTQSPYAASKVGADKVAESFHLSYGLPVATLRPFNTYGPRQSERAVIPTIVRQSLSGGPIQLGSITPTRDFTYVSDTVDGFIRLASAQDAVGRVVNVGSNSEISIADVVAIVGELTGQELVINTDRQRTRPRNSEVERLVCDNTLAAKVMGWKPTITLRQGLMKTISFWKERGSDESLGRYHV